MYKVDRRVYIDTTGKKLVSGPPDSAELFRPRGGEVTQKEIDEWGKELTKYIPELKEQKKKQEKKEDKSYTPTQNKGRPKKKDSEE